MLLVVVCECAWGACVVCCCVKAGRGMGGWYDACVCGCCWRMLAWCVHGVFSTGGEQRCDGFGACAGNYLGAEGAAALGPDVGKLVNLTSLNLSGTYMAV